MHGRIAKAPDSGSLCARSDLWFHWRVFLRGNDPFPFLSLAIHRSARSMFQIHCDIACDAHRSLLFAWRTLSLFVMENRVGPCDTFAWAANEWLGQPSNCARIGRSTSQPHIVQRQHWIVASDAFPRGTYPAWSAAGGRATTCLFSHRLRTCWVGAELTTTTCRRVSPKPLAVQVAT